MSTNPNPPVALAAACKWVVRCPRDCKGYILTPRNTTTWKRGDFKASPVVIRPCDTCTQPATVDDGQHSI